MTIEHWVIGASMGLMDAEILLAKFSNGISGSWQETVRY